MFRSKTVFVLGAGASAEVGLPVGETLLKQIARLVDIKYDFGTQKSGDRLVSEALKSALGEGREVTQYNEHLHAAWQIGMSAEQALSIDNIVDGLEDSKVELVAKLGIARAIHQAESDSDFFRVPTGEIGFLEFSKFNSTWYSHLTKLLCENRRRSQLSAIFENLSFISFNYDRCIERYLPQSIANYYGVPQTDVLQFFREVKIHRPYGIAGEIGWDNAGNARGFGGGNSQYLLEAARNIRTFTEGVENPTTLKAMKLDLVESDRIVFLGSAFHRQNLELLRCKIKPSAKIFATSGSISNEDLEVIRDELRDVFSLRKSDSEDMISFAKMYCNEFFRTYWRTLTA